ncbi:MAG: hypothetical protein ABR505_04470 [Actinomycetota bacterium]
MTRATANWPAPRELPYMDYIEPLAGSPEEADAMTKHLVEFLQANVKAGQEATVAVNRALNAVLVYIDGELALSCSMDDLRRGPGVSPN